MARLKLFLSLCVAAAAGFAQQPQQAQTPIKVNVDASEATRRLIHATLQVPVRPGPVTLLYPKWIPGEHGPTGPIEDLAGMKITGNGQPIAWSRDSVDMYAFHV